ncbi:GntR family transcriptional regulator [Amycolatopsis dongchuanensis]|uniref:GntR family transcriptional regulator n=1 Tax=Amycolatopsis dongchuanensis TaxID=1070866 RepID=A0ABP9R6J6_9PSEU
MALPIYREIRADLEARIRRGELAVGDRVPTEAQLQRTYGVSRATAQRALQELAAAGLVVRHRKRGTFVADGARQVNLWRWINLEPHGPEMPGRHVVQGAGVVTAAEADMTLPELAADTPVVQLRRVKLTPEDVPVGLELSAVPFSVAPRLLSEPLEDLAIHDYLARQGVEVARSRLYIEPGLLGAQDAETLGAEQGCAVLQFLRVSWLASGEVGEVSRIILPPGHSEFYIEQTLSRPERTAERSADDEGDAP